MANMTTEFVAVGRRKTATARVRLRHGVGKMFVNGEELSVYFPTEAMRCRVEQPLKATEKFEKFDVHAKCDGGGKAGQADALRHGISRALLKVDPTLRPALKAAGYLTRDQRMRERKKPGRPGARKRFQFSKR
jgi:small subunit ribosomal protein S9